MMIADNPDCQKYNFQVWCNVEMCQRFLVILYYPDRINVRTVLSGRDLSYWGWDLGLYLLRLAGWCTVRYSWVQQYTHLLMVLIDLSKFSRCPTVSPSNSQIKPANLILYWSDTEDPVLLNSTHIYVCISMYCIFIYNNIRIDNVAT